MAESTTGQIEQSTPGINIFNFQCITLPGRLKQIDAGAGQVYGVNDADNIARWINDTWEGVPGALIHVSVGPAGVWGANRANNVFKLQDNTWMSVTGKLRQVDAGGDKFVVGVNDQNKVFCLRQSCTVSRSSAVTFTQLDGELKYYSCGLYGCWGVNAPENIFFRQNVDPKACQGTQWQQIDGKLSMIEVSTDGSVFGINSEGKVFKREGISIALPTGTSWTEIDLCGTYKHLSYDNGYLWLIGPNGEIDRCADQSVM